MGTEWMRGHRIQCVAASQPLEGEWMDCEHEDIVRKLCECAPPRVVYICVVESRRTRRV